MTELTIYVFAARLPTLTVLVVGLILCLRLRRTRPGRAVNLGLAGLALLIGATVGGWLATLYTIYGDRVGLRPDVVSLGSLVAAASLAIGLANLVGLGLLVAGLVSRVGAYGVVR